MPEPLNILSGLALNILGNFVRGFIRGPWGNAVDPLLRKVLDAAARRFSGNSLPLNHRLDCAFRRSLGSAALAVAYNLYNPKQRPMTALLEHFRDWPTFVRRFAEIVQNNIVPGTEKEFWLFRLIDESRDADNFEDFPINLALNNHQFTDILHSNSEGEFRDHVNREFLAWVERHVPDNGSKPRDFATVVQYGWTSGGQTGARPLTFFDIFKLFFLKALEEEPEVFRAYWIAGFSGLRKDFAGIKQGLSDTVSLQQLEEALQRFYGKDIDAIFKRFTEWTGKQNEELIQSLQTEVAAVRQHLQLHDQKISNTYEEVKETQKDHNQRIASLEKTISSQSWMKQAMQPNEPAARLDFPRALREWAAHHDVTLEEARKEVEHWIAAVRLKSTDQSERARAEMLAQRFPEAARLSIEAAEANLVRSRELASDAREQEKESLRLAAAAVEDFTRAGESLRAEGCLNDALVQFEKALEHSPYDADSVRWASLQIWLGICHSELGTRLEGRVASSHLYSSVGAYRNALKVYFREQLPWEWAITQNNLGIALGDQAERSEGPEAVRLFRDAVKAYHESLTVNTHKQMPQFWAMTQNNLGVALRKHAQRSEGPEAQWLLGEAVNAFYNALKVYTYEQMPESWAATQNNLGIALSDQAQRTEGPEAIRLCCEALRVFHDSHKVYTRERLPRQWALSQNNLGSALRDQADRSKDPTAGHLLHEAVRALRDALMVNTREQFPQEWARTQNNLGATLHQQARRSEGPEAACLLNQAVNAYRKALQVRTREQQPQSWALTQNNLGAALREHAGWSEGSRKLNLLDEAVSAFHNALMVFAREQFPQDWARTQNYLGAALRDQAEHYQEPKGLRLLADSISAYRNALEVRTRNHFPQDWALTQINLATALRDHSKRIDEPEKTQLLCEAVSAYRDSLNIYTRQDLPHYWALTQNNLGLALSDQAERSEGPERLRLLGEAVIAFRGALEVFLAEHLPNQHRIVRQNLDTAETELAKHLREKE